MVETRWAVNFCLSWSRTNGKKQTWSQSARLASQNTEMYRSFNLESASKSALFRFSSSFFLHQDGNQVKTIMTLRPAIRAVKPLSVTTINELQEKIVEKCIETDAKCENDATEWITVVGPECWPPLSQNFYKLNIKAHSNRNYRLVLSGKFQGQFLPIFGQS